MGDITEQKYLEVCEDFKNMIAQKDKEMFLLKNNIKVLGKIVAESYGVVKIIDNTLHNLESNLDSVIMIKKLIEVLRTDLSDTVEEMLVGKDDD
tara:strand:+ start:605 stop:886 length:282 start_codon:yes stop_codon:yes gene_type:complete